MKKLILLLIVVGSITQAQAQKKLMAKDVPTAVKDAFSKAYQMEKDIDWCKDGNNYEAEYDSKKGDMAAIYSADGQLVSTEMDISIADLPSGVMEYLLKNHKDHKVKEASKTTNVDGTITYETEVQGMDLIFDSNGKYLKSKKA